MTTLAIMSHHLHALSPLLSSPHLRSKQPRISGKNSSVVKNLQGLFDQQSTLPFIKRSSHPDLLRISSETLSSLLQNPTANFLIIDARYPFEYAGGHIKSAQNIYTETDLHRLFTQLISSPTRPALIIFHCEFSSERAPRLCRLFRSLDRQYNLANYPQLSFPSIYLLDGGYAQFYHQSSTKEFCEPKGYVSMFEEQYHDELRIYRQTKKLSKRLIERPGPIQFCMS